MHTDVSYPGARGALFDSFIEASDALHAALDPSRLMRGAVEGAVRLGAAHEGLWQRLEAGLWREVERFSSGRWTSPLPDGHAGFSPAQGLRLAVGSEEEPLAVVELIPPEGKGLDPEGLRWARELVRMAGALVERDRKLLRQAQETVRARDLFVSMASHELRSPITAAKMQLQSLRRGLSRGDPAYLTLERVMRTLTSSERSLDRLAQLVDDMLDISRIQNGQLSLRPKEMDLAAMAREVIDRHGLQLQEARIAVSFDAPAPVVGRWDKSRVEQVIVNLLTNALRYAPHAPLEVSVRSEEGFAQLCFEDHGPGIPVEKQELIFERFERLEAAGQFTGLGLGLFIARQIAQMHGGELRVESEDGEGARFVLRLPLDAKGAASPPAPTAP